MAGAALIELAVTDDLGLTATDWVREWESGRPHDLEYWAGRAWDRLLAARIRRHLRDPAASPPQVAVAGAGG